MAEQSTRIEQVTTANTANDARLAPVVQEQAYWTPGKGTLFIATLAIGLLGAVGPLVASGVFTVPAIIAAICTGLTGALATFFGIKSGGSPK